MGHPDTWLQRERAFIGMSKSARFGVGLLLVLIAAIVAAQAAPRKAHVVVLGATRQVRYSKTGDPAGAAQGEMELKIRALLVDGVLKEWTTGEAHDVTDRSFVVRRVIKLNDSLPNECSASGDKTGDGNKPTPSVDSAPSNKPTSGDKATAGVKPASAPAASSARAASPWVWQRGPWLLVDRVTGHVIALKLPHYEPGVSEVSWFRDYGAYCGVTANGKSLYAVVAQVEARKPVLAKKLAAYDAENHPQPVCGPAEWQREPLRVIFHPTGKDAASVDVEPGSAVLVEDGAESRD
jgi:hypothetical protein